MVAWKQQSQLGEELSPCDGEGGLQFDLPCIFSVVFTLDCAARENDTVVSVAVSEGLRRPYRFPRRPKSTQRAERHALDANANAAIANPPRPELAGALFRREA